MNESEATQISELECFLAANMPSRGHLHLLRDGDDFHPHPSPCAPLRHPTLLGPDHSGVLQRNLLVFQLC